MQLVRQMLSLAAAVLVSTSVAAGGEDTNPPRTGDVIMVQVAPGVIHYEYSPDHIKYSWLVGAEWQRASRWLAGYSYFDNSFGQRCHYLYGGRWWQLGDEKSNWYFKVTGGVIEGYKGIYEDNIPHNRNGFAPAIIPGLGYRIDRFNVQLNTLGIRGVMFTFGYDLFR